MANFGSGLVQGFQVGEAARARRVQEGRQAEGDAWQRQDRALLERQRALDEAASRAGAAAMGMGGGELGSGIDEALNARVHRLAAALTGRLAGKVREVVPSYRSLLVLHDPLRHPRAALVREIER